MKGIGRTQFNSGVILARRTDHNVADVNISLAD